MWFKYKYKMSSLERFRSSRDASKSSLSFRFHFFSELRKKFFTTCCVMVDAPSRLRPGMTSPPVERAPQAAVGRDHLAGDEGVVVPDAVEGGDLARDVEVAGHDGDGA